MRKRKKKPGEERPAEQVALDSSVGRRPPFGVASSLALGAAILVLALGSTGLGAKEKKVSRSVAGQVLDQDENGVAGATVELTDLQTGKKLAMFSEDGGRYKFSDLEPSHDYELQATNQTAASEVRKISSFDNRNTFVINLRISPAKPQ